MKRQLTLISVALIVSVLAIAFAASSVTAAFQPNRIIDDVVFDNTSTMDAAKINGFLNSFPKSCISPNSGFQARVPNGYSPDGGYTYGDFSNAGDVIYAASQTYGINPQVLLVTLEKEQSLVTGKNSSTYCSPGDDNNHKYAAAVGYGCPDSGTRYYYNNLELYRRNGVTQTSVGPTCVNTASKAGFSQQVIRAAWLLKFGEQRSEGKVGWSVVKGNWNNSDDPQTCYGGPMTQGSYQRCSGGQAASYDGYTTIDGGSVHMDSGATAALYWYTPHLHGNQVFSDLFNSWFGLPYGTKILKADGDPAFYLYNNGQKLKIPSYATYQAYGFDKVGVTIVSPDYLSNIPSGNDLSTLGRGADGTVHLIAEGKRYIVTGATCASWGLDCYNPYVVNTIDSDMLNVPSYAGYLQPLMRDDSTGGIFKMVAGKKQPFLNTDAIPQNGFDFTQISGVEHMNALQPLGVLLPSLNTAFKVANSGTIYVYTGGTQYVAVGDVDTFYAWGLDHNFFPSAPASTFDSQPPTTNLTISQANRYVTSGGKKYVVDSGHKLDLSADSSDWPSGSALAGMDQEISNLPTIGVDGNSCYRTSSGGIVEVQSSALRIIRTFDDVYRLGCNPDTLIPMSSTLTSSLGSGPDKLPLSRAFKKPGDGAIYLLTAANTSVKIPSYAIFTALGLVPSDVYDVNALTASAYPMSGTAASYGQKDGVYYIFSTAGVKYIGTKDTLQQWGVTSFDPVYGGVVGNRLPSINATLFAHTPDGAIYYASGGSRHLITNYSAYVRLGGAPANTMEVQSDFIASLPAGSDISQ